MTLAILRADGSSRLGMGHIMRCLAFADGLHDLEGIESIFVTRALDSCVSDLVQAKGHGIEEIPANVTASEDAELTYEIAVANGANLIVTDLCHRAALENKEELEVYHRLLTDSYFTICFAGSDGHDLSADIVISPYLGTTYPPSVIENKRTFLMGPSYFVFRPEFIEAAQVSRTIAKRGRRILVTVGGGDELHLTTKITKAICMLPDQDLLGIRIVFGPAYTAELKHEVLDLMRRFEGKYVSLDHTTNMAEAMLWTDLAITGDGLTKYETAVTGTPSIMLSRPQSEELLNEEFEKAGSTMHLGDGSQIDVNVLAQSISEILQNVELRTEMSQRGRTLVDGKGIERIISNIPPGVFQ